MLYLRFHYALINIAVYTPLIAAFTLLSYDAATLVIIYDGYIDIYAATPFDATLLICFDTSDIA